MYTLYYCHPLLHWLSYCMLRVFFAHINISFNFYLFRYGPTHLSRGSKITVGSRFCPSILAFWSLWNKQKIIILWSYDCQINVLDFNSDWERSTKSLVRKDLSSPTSPSFPISESSDRLKSWSKINFPWISTVPGEFLSIEFLKIELH